MLYNKGTRKSLLNELLILAPKTHVIIYAYETIHNIHNCTLKNCVYLALCDNNNNTHLKIFSTSIKPV